MTNIDPPPNSKLGTFAGVFTPSVLTILGIILFLRLGYVVGNAGLARAFIIIAVANLISVLTSFSLAAIATNMKIKGGGDYYLISRTLGLEFGGAIGIVLFLAQSVSIAFYCIGFGEAITSIMSGSGMERMPQIIAAAALIFLFCLAWVGADLATKFQYIVMAFLILALTSFYIGGINHWDTHMLVENWSHPKTTGNFWILFALFFPAVTGFTQGVSMSGDLEDPGKSLPAGTFFAVALSICVYFSVAVIFAAANPLSVLASDYDAMKKTAVFSFFIDAGVIAATLSSAMASFLGAPRILQSLSSDKIFPFLNVFAVGHGPANNPRRGVLLSFGIAGLTIFLGQLDLIAGIVSMFFLISYGLLNYATYFEAAAQSPSFRPRFKWYNKRLSLAGFLACFGVMLAIDFKTGIASAAVLYAIFQYLKRTALPARWSDSQRSHHLKTIRENLLSAQENLAHPRDWRPFILALSNKDEQMIELLEFSSLIEGNSGITAAVQSIQGVGYKAAKQKEAILKNLTLVLKEKGYHAFPLVLSTPDLPIGLSALFQTFGIGPVRANTVLLNWNEHQHPSTGTRLPVDDKTFFRSALHNGCNIILFDLKPPFNEPNQSDRAKTIDVWWNNDDTSRLMILLAYLMTRNEGWSQVEIRLMAIHLDSDTPENLQTLTTMLEDIRIDAAPRIVLNIDNQSVINISKTSDFVFLPVRFKGKDMVTLKGIPITPVLNRLNSVAMVMAAQKIDLDTEPEEGKPGELAMMMDELKHAEKRVETAEKQVYKTTKEAAQLMKSVNIEDSFADSKVLEDLKKALAARENANQANQKALKERGKLIGISEKIKDQGFFIDQE